MKNVKMMALLMAFCLVTVSVMVAMATVTRDDLTDFPYGDGSPGNPYLISNVNELQNMNGDLSAHYALADDIDARETKTWNDGAGFVPVGDDTTPFAGSLDGRNHTITGLHVNLPDASYVGLFGYMGAGAVVRHLGMVHNEIVGYIYAGGIAGYGAGTVTDSYSTGNTTAFRDAGGVLGRNQLGLVEYCYASGDVSGTSGNSWYIGGLVGYNNEGTVGNSYATGAVTGPGYVGGFAGYNRLGTLSHSYSTGSVTGGNNVGGFAGYNSDGTVDTCFWDIETSGTDVGIADGIVTGATGGNTSEMMRSGTYAGWDFTNTWWMVNRETRPFLRTEHHTEIRTPHQLQLVAMDRTAHYTLVNDIDLGGYITHPARMWGTSETSGHGFVPVGNSTIGGFMGSFHGNNNTIHGMYINRPDQRYIGLFGQINGGVSVSDTIIRDATIEGNQFTGGIVGNSLGAVDNCEFHGTIMAPHSSYVGGIVGRNTVDTISNCYSSGYIRGNRVGGIAGENHVTVRDCSSTMTVQGSAHLGGLVGFLFSGEIVNCSYVGTVAGPMAISNVGGLVGYSRGTILDSRAMGDVTGGYYSGGLVGRNFGGTVEGSYATGSITGRGPIGGLVGSNEGTVTDSYARVEVTRGPDVENQDVGGFVGNNSGIIINCYSTGRVSYQGAPDPTEKGFVGVTFQDEDYEMSGNYWDLETSNQTGTAGNATGRTTAEMKTQSTFQGWDFDDTWHMVEGLTYPLLQWEALPGTVSTVIDLHAHPDSQGWNFVSFDLIPEDTGLETLLSGIEGNYDQVMYYDSSTGGWSSHVPGRLEHFNNLQMWDNTMGIWIKMNADATLTVEGYVPGSTDITLHPGWNMVGLPSESAGNHDLPAEVTRIGYIDPSEEYNVAYTDEVDTFEFAPGNGYWVFNGGEHTVVWTVTY